MRSTFLCFSICFLFAFSESTNGQDDAAVDLVGVSPINQFEVVDSVPVSPPAAVFDITGTWQLEWDDSINRKMDANSKFCSIEFENIGSTITGKFHGPVLGETRNAIFTGEILGNGTPLLNFVQRETGYACTYQIWWAPNESGMPLGVWTDTRGRHGEFKLLKYQNIKEPAPKTD